MAFVNAWRRFWIGSDTISEIVGLYHDFMIIKRNQVPVQAAKKKSAEDELPLMDPDESVDHSSAELNPKETAINRYNLQFLQQIAATYPKLFSDWYSAKVVKPGESIDKYGLTPSQREGLDSLHYLLFGWNQKTEENGYVLSPSLRVSFWSAAFVASCGGAFAFSNWLTPIIYTTVMAGIGATSVAAPPLGIILVSGAIVCLLLTAITYAAIHFFGSRNIRNQHKIIRQNKEFLKKSEDTHRQMRDFLKLHPEMKEFIPEPPHPLGSPAETLSQHDALTTLKATIAENARQQAQRDAVITTGLATMTATLLEFSGRLDGVERAIQTYKISPTARREINAAHASDGSPEKSPEPVTISSQPSLPFIPPDVIQLRLMQAGCQQMAAAMGAMMQHLGVTEVPIPGATAATQVVADAEEQSPLMAPAAPKQT